MKPLIVIALLFAPMPVIASRHHKHAALAAKRCGAMGEDESHSCVAGQIRKGLPAIVTFECPDGVEVDVRVWYSAGEFHMRPRTAEEACDKHDAPGMDL
jgi:hypothetical protein